ncbi:hypothetical protein [Winogradskyella sp.]
MKRSEAHAKFKAITRALRQDGLKFFEIEEIFRAGAEELVTEENNS